VAAGEDSEPRPAYEEVLPPIELRGLVRCVWLRRDDAPEDSARRTRASTPSPTRVLPDNCADWIFDLSPPVAPRDEEPGRSASRALAVGPMTRPLDVPARPGSMMLGVRFAPGRWRRLFGDDAERFRDRRDDLLGLPLVVPGAPERLLSRLLEARDERSLVAATFEELRGVVSLETVDPVVARAIAELEGAGGRTRIEALARRLGCTRQHLASRFRRDVGLSPKVFARVLRFRAALGAARDAVRVGWASIALELGYGDQSHLLRDFRRFAGAPPTRLGAGPAESLRGS
jgi:AraC-like DNA-binding protein